VAETPPHGLTLLGVVIGADRRLALIQSAGHQEELVPIGQSLAGYRLVDVEENQVTLEGQQGERIVLRMPTDGKASGPAVRR
jgi:type II secretory pathway component PulC